MNDAILIQQIYPDTPGVKLFDLTREHHQVYCDRFNIDYQCLIDDPAPHFDKNLGQWAKIELISQAMRHYTDIIWLDADTLIKDIDVNIRYAIQTHKIGACWQRIPQFPLGHWNTGALYIHNCDRTRAFMDAWIDAYPPPNDGWLEQGIFNRLGREMGTVVTLSDKWNATIDVSMVPDAVVLGFHGQGNPENRYNVMRAAMERLFPAPIAEGEKVIV